MGRKSDEKVIHRLLEDGKFDEYCTNDSWETLSKELRCCSKTLRKIGEANGRSKERLKKIKDIISKGESDKDLRILGPTAKHELEKKFTVVSNKFVAVQEQLNLEKLKSRQREDQRLHKGLEREQRRKEREQQRKEREEKKSTQQKTQQTQQRGRQNGVPKPPAAETNRQAETEQTQDQAHETEQPKDEAQLQPEQLQQQQQEGVMAEKLQEETTSEMKTPASNAATSTGNTNVTATTAATAPSPASTAATSTGNTNVMATTAATAPSPASTAATSTGNTNVTATPATTLTSLKPSSPGIFTSKKEEEKPEKLEQSVEMDEWKQQASKVDLGFGYVNTPRKVIGKKRMNGTSTAQDDASTSTPAPALAGGVTSGNKTVGQSTVKKPPAKYLKKDSASTPASNQDIVMQTQEKFNEMTIGAQGGTVETEGTSPPPAAGGSTNHQTNNQRQKSTNSSAEGMPGNGGEDAKSSEPEEKQQPIPTNTNDALKNKATEAKLPAAGGKKRKVSEEENEIFCAQMLLVDRMIYSATQKTLEDNLISAERKKMMREAVEHARI